MPSFRVFLSKRMKNPNENPMTKMAWNKNNGLIASGFGDGRINLYLITPSRETPGSVDMETVQMLDAHRKKITTLAWSENGKYLATGDSSGKIAFFAKREKGWKNTVANSSVTSSVNCIAFSKNSKTAAIAYADSTCACVGIEGELNWSIEMPRVIEFVEWSPNHKNLLCGTSYGEVIILDDHGVETGFVPLPCLARAKVGPKLAGIEWHPRADYGLLIAFRGRNVQIGRKLLKK